MWPKMLFRHARGSFSMNGITAGLFQTSWTRKMLLWDNWSNQKNCTVWMTRSTIRSKFTWRTLSETDLNWRKNTTLLWDSWKKLHQNLIKSTTKLLSCASDVNTWKTWTRSIRRPRPVSVKTSICITLTKPTCRKKTCINTLKMTRHRLSVTRQRRHCKRWMKRASYWTALWARKARWTAMNGKITCPTRVLASLKQSRPFRCNRLRQNRSIMPRVLLLLNRQKWSIIWTRPTTMSSGTSKTRGDRVASASFDLRIPLIFAFISS